MNRYSIAVLERVQETGESYDEALEKLSMSLDQAQLQGKDAVSHHKEGGDTPKPADTGKGGDTQGAGGGSVSTPEVIPYPPPLTLGDITTQTPPEIKWIVPGLIPQGCVGLIQGLPSSGKSYFSLYTAIAIANGTNLMGKTPTPGVSVRYVSLEDGAEVVHWRALRVCETIKPKPTADFQAFCWQGIPIVVRSRDGVSLSPVGKALIDDIRKTQKPTLLIIDHWTLSVKGLRDENSATEVGDVLRVLHGVCKSAKCTIALVHHQAKSGKDQSPIYASRGSTTLPASARFILGVQQAEDKEISFLEEKTDGTYITVDAVKVSFGRRPSKSIFRISPGGYFYPVETDTKAQKLHTIAEAVCECVTKASPYLSIRDLTKKPKFKKALSNLNVSLAKKGEIRALLEEAANKGLIEKYIDNEHNSTGRKPIKYGPVEDF